MYRFLLTPRWLAVHTLFVLAVAFCAFAGWWQFSAYDDSQSRHDERDLPPAPVSEIIGPEKDVDDAEDRSISAEGRYLTDQQRLIPGRIRDGILGWYVLVPLETPDGTILPVLRGWVAEQADADVPATSPVTVTGHVLPSEVPDHATVRSDQVLEDDELAYIAPEAIAEATGISAAAMVDGYVLLDSEDPATDDVALLDVDQVAPIRNVNPWQNLSYWAQWWVFGLAALVFWASVIRTAVRSRRRASEQPDEAANIDVSEPEPRRVPS